MPFRTGIWIILFSLAGAFSAVAAPVAPDGFVNLQNDLRHPANVSNTDNRGALSVRGPQLGLTAAEMAEIRRSTGYMFCPGAMGSAFIATVKGEPANAPQVIVTVAHSLFDEYGQKLGPWSKCFFQNQEGRIQHSYFDLNEGGYEVGTRIPNQQNQDNDWAVIRLLAPIEGASGFPVDETRQIFQRKPELIVVSAYQQRMPGLVPKTEPIVQSGPIKDIYFANGISEAMFMADLSTTKGASGSIAMARVNGRLTALAVISGGGPIESDGQPYSSAPNDPDPKKLGGAKGLVIDTKIIAAIKKLKGMPSSAARRM